MTTNARKPTRIDVLTDEQRSRMASFAQEWIDRGHRTRPLSDEEWKVWEDGARACYGFAGKSWPGVVVRVPSPIVGAFAAPTAAFVVAKIRRDAVGAAIRNAVGDVVDVAVGGAVGDAVGEAVAGAVDGAVDGAVHRAVRGAVHGAVRGAVGEAVDDAVHGAVGDAVRGAVGDALDGAVGGAVDGAVHRAVSDAVDDAVGGAVRDAVDVAVHRAVDGAVRDAVRGAVGEAVDDAVRGAVSDVVDDAVRNAVRGAVDDAVGDAVGGAVGGAVDVAVDVAVGDAVDGAVRAAVGGAVREAVRNAVDGAVRGAVGVAERKAVLGTISNLYWNRFGGIHWTGWWSSCTAYFRDICELQLPGDLWDRSRALEAAQSAGWWWPFEDFVMVCDVPSELHLEQVGPPGWGSHRLHCEDGPSVGWDGWGIYSWHGTTVPAWVIKNPTVEQIMAEPNTEIRRCAIESLGWAQFIDTAGMQMVAEPVDDPGNPGQTLALYDLGEQWSDLYPEPARILLANNASLDKGGHRRVFGLVVPARHSDPIAAAADLFDVPEAAYRGLARAS